MKKILLVAIAAITFVAMVSSCGSGPSSSDPKATLAAFIKAMGKKDIKEARKYVTKESQSIMDMLEQAFALSTKLNIKAEEKANPFNEANVVVGDASINGDVATIPVTEKINNQTTNIILKKEEGAWKVAFDTDTMAEMAGEKARREGDNMNVDSLKNALQQLNSDSAMKAMQEGMKQADSLLKAMKK